MDDLEQYTRNLAYRIGYGAAWRWSEIRTQDELVGVIIRRIGVLDTEDLEAIREGINDAIAGRQPSW
jgi:hypothetical protein